MSRKTVVLRILKTARASWPSFIGALIFSVVSVALTLFCPILIGRAVDLIIGPGNVDFYGMLPILILFLCSLAGAALFSWLTSCCTNRISYKTVLSLRNEEFRRILKVPLKFIDSHAHGDIMSRVINDIDTLSDGLLQGFSQLFTGIMTIIGTLIFMLAINPYVTLAVVVITPLSLFVASFIAKNTHRTFTEQSRVRGEISAYIEETVNMARVVKAFCYEEAAQNKFRDINERLYESGVRSQFYSSLTNPCTRFVNGVVYAAAGIFGAILTLRGVISVGQLSSFLIYANQYTKPFNEISGVITELQSALASAARVFEILDEEEEAPDSGNRVLKAEGGEVALDKVSFSYRPGQRLIEDLNLIVKNGEHVAIVGPTGCGKTTLINLLMRFYDVTSGQILVDGSDIRKVTRHSLRSQYGMVLQDTWLFSGSVHDNIAYSRQGVAREEVIAAAKSAHAHSFITRLPNGYDTILSEGGENLSEGQRQLLCIARVMLSPPPILILDEATSSIDTLTEIRIQKAFNKLTNGRTSFIVAHRLSTIREADTILVMKSGSVLEQGSHEELLDRRGFYYELYNSQFMPSEG